MNNTISVGRFAAILSCGFRPFFLFSGVSALALVLWLLAYGGLGVSLGPAGKQLWHAHEMVFGFATATLAGFLLTAVPKWTRSASLAGWRLGALASLWLVGRIAFALPWA